MFRRFSINFAIFSMLLDAAIIAGSLYSASYLRPILSQLPFVRTIDQPIQLPPHLYIVFTLIWVAIFLLLAVYDGRRNVYITEELTNLLVGSLLATVALAGTLYLSLREVSRVLFLAFIVLGFSLLTTWRLLARIVFRLSGGKSRKTRNVLIIGSGPVGQEILNKIERHPYLGLRPAGFLDDDPTKQSSDGNVLGSTLAARAIIRAHQIDDVVIALPRRAHEKVNQMVLEMHDLPVKVWVIPDYFHLALHKATIEEFAGIPLLDLRAPALNDYQRMIKRAFDLAVGLTLALPTLALMSLIGIAIRLEGPGPIIFRQKRVGEGGRMFDMLKFRTMIPNAEDLVHLVERQDDKGQLIYKSATDPRVTKVGSLLRRTSMDELPQIINLIKGEMSLVGPRPEMPYLVDKYEPWQHKRFAVPQGITGWWQVNGRSDKPMHLHTEDDLYYVQNYSLLLDLKILIKTILVVMRGKGAY